MSQCLAKPQKPAFQPRSEVGQGVGSHSTFQSVVEAVIQLVRKPDEHMDFVQARQIKGCLAAGWVRPECCLRWSWRSPVCCRAGIGTLAPSPLPLATGAHSQFFPTFL